jgi:molybdopterin-guanine dinucleotide biosynthesis protein
VTVRLIRKGFVLPIVSIVGHPDSGKSTLLESLAGELGKRGRRVAVVRQGEDLPRYSDAVARLAEGGLDLMIVDGLLNESDPRIEVHRSGAGAGLQHEAGDLLAVVSDTALEIDCPRFAMEEIGAIAGFLEEKLVESGSHGTVLLVNGAPVPLSPFPQEMFTKTILGMVSSLKGVGEVRSVSIITRKGTSAPRESNRGGD